MRFLRYEEEDEGLLHEESCEDLSEQVAASSCEPDMVTDEAPAQVQPDADFTACDERAVGELTPAILNVIDALVVVLDHEGRIVLFNRACEDSTGYSFADVAGTHVWDRLLPPEEAAGVREVFEGLRSGDYPNSHENRWVSRDGQTRLIEWSNTAIANPDGSVRYVIGTGVDISDRRLAEDGIRWRTEDLTLINTLSESANRGDDLRTIARLLALGTRKGLSTHGCGLYVLDDAGTHLIVEGFNLSEGAGEKIEEITDGQKPETMLVRLDDCPSIGDVIRTGSSAEISGEDEVIDHLREIIAASDIPADQRPAALSSVPSIREALDVSSIVLMPIVSEGEPLGVLSIGGPSALTDIQRSRLTGIARHVAGIISHRRAEQALRESEASLAAAQRIAGIGNWTWDMERDLRRWSNEVYRIIGRTREECPATYENFLAAVHPDDRDRIRSTLERAVSTRRRYSASHRIMRPDGSVVMVHERGEFKFDERGKPILMVGMMRDITKESRSKELQNVLLAIAEAVNRTESLEDLLAAIHRQLGRLIDTTNFYVAVFDEDSGTYSFPYHVDEYDDASELGPTYLGKSLTDYVRRTGEPLMVDEQAYQELIASGEVEQIGAPSTAWLGVPLKSGGKDIGVVAVQSYSQISPYTPNDLRLMSFVSDNIAMAVGRKLAEEQVNQRLHMEETISDVASGLIIHGVEQTDEAVEEALSSAGSLLGAGHCFTWMAEPCQESATDVYEWCAEDAPPLIHELSATVPTCAPWLLASANDHGFVRIETPEELPPEAGALRHLLESNRINSLLAVPLREGRKLTGLVGVLDHHKGARSAQSVMFLKTMAAALENALERRRADVALRSSYESLRSTVEGTVDALSRLGEARDPYTAGHQQRVAEVACAIAGEMGFPADRIEGLGVASKLHDIGKIHVPGEILSKPGALNELEFGIIKTHPRVGYEILRAVEFPWPVAEVALQHHERLDGSGYPDGLSGESISPEARIVAVADVMEAMCTHRPYRPALPIEAAIEELSSNRGTLYGPTAVDACLKLLRTGRLNLSATKSRYRGR